MVIWRYSFQRIFKTPRDTCDEPDRTIICVPYKSQTKSFTENISWQTIRNADIRRESRWTCEPFILIFLLVFCVWVVCKSGGGGGDGGRCTQYVLHKFCGLYRHGFGAAQFWAREDCKKYIIFLFFFKYTHLVYYNRDSERIKAVYNSQIVP